MIKSIGCYDKDIDLFEGQYPVKDGISYNSYIVIGEKIAVMDTVDINFVEKWLENIDNTLQGVKPDYLVVNHLEPDHSSGIVAFMEKFPNAILVATAKAIAFLPQFFDYDFTNRTMTVGEGATLDLGGATLKFMLAPMVHWPEVMMTYYVEEKALFSADAFGSFGDCGVWPDEARRYYINIVGKYGANVQSVLKKASALDIKTICPLHGKVLCDNLGYYLDLYNTWSSYKPETSGVLIAYANIYGHTKAVCQQIFDKLVASGVKAEMIDLNRTHLSFPVSKAFQYDRLVLASITYDGGIMPVMQDFLSRLKIKNYSNRKVALVENGTWGIVAGKKMTEQLEQMKNIEIVDTTLSVKTGLVDQAKIDEFVEKIKA